MKILIWLFGIVTLLSAAVGILQYAASERVEVVELNTQAADGSNVVTRLWVVDHEDVQYLRMGKSGSGWYERLRAHPRVSLVRQGAKRDYVAESRPRLSADINALMQAKYTWGDTVIGYMFGSRDGSIPIALLPVPDEDGAP